MDTAIQILDGTTGFGGIGISGNLGYGGIQIDPPAALRGWEFISTHAAASIEVQVYQPVELVGFFNVSAEPVTSATFWATGNYVGTISGKHETTLDHYGTFRLWPGKHKLEIMIPGSNSGCHTVWAYRPAT